MTALGWVAAHHAPHVWLEIRYRFAPGVGPSFSATTALVLTLLMRACDVGWCLVALWWDARIRQKRARLHARLTASRVPSPQQAGPQNRG